MVNPITRTLSIKLNIPITIASKTPTLVGTMLIAYPSSLLPGPASTRNDSYQEKGEPLAFTNNFCKEYYE